MSEDKPKLTIGELAAKPSQPGEPTPQAPKEQQDPSRPARAEADQYLFFNVMPKVSVTQDSLVSASVKITPEQPAVTSQNGRSTTISGLWHKYHWWVVLTLVAVVLVGAGLFIYSKMTAVKEGDLLNSQALLKPVSKQPAPNTPVLTTATPKEWQKKYFNSETCTNVGVCADAADPDHDGLSNLEEFKLGTDPNNPDSDQDGLADGDEVKVFGSNPLSAHTGKDIHYNDADYVKGGYSLFTEQQMTTAEITNYTDKMKQYGLHAPTTGALKDALINIYKFTDWTITDTANSSTTPNSTASTTPATTTPISGVSNTVEAKQDRDAQRSAAIKNIGIALIKYQEDSKVFPKTTDFLSMFNTIKAYLKVATRPDDPINKDPYVYKYELSTDGSDYTLSFYSEVAGQIIKKHAADAQKDLDADEAAINDDQRVTDVEMIKTALLLYSSKNAGSNQDNVFPSETKYKTELVAGGYISQIPKDPKTGSDYQYQVSDSYDTFTVRAILENPPKGTTGYLCNQDECRNY